MSLGQHLPTAHVKITTRAESEKAQSENAQKWAKWELGRTLENPGFSLLLVLAIPSPKKKRKEAY